MNANDGAHGFAALLKRHSLLVYFVVAYLVTWSIEIPIALSVQGLISAQVPLWLHYFASFGPLVAAALVTALTEGGDAVRSLLGRIVKWRVDWRYYAFAALIPLALFAVAVVLDRLLTGSWPDLSLLGKADYLP